MSTRMAARQNPARFTLGAAMLVSMTLLAGCGGNPPQTVTTTTTTAPAPMPMPMPMPPPGATSTTQTTNTTTP